MTVEKGMDWGWREPLPGDGVVCRSDAEARAVIEEAKRKGLALPSLGLLGGDLCKTLGGLREENRLRSEDAVTFPVDLGSALIDGTIHWFVAHLIARRGWLRGRFVVAMNAEWLGRWDLGPRAHPGDGLLDVSDGNLTLGERLKAYPRLKTGTHLPHPDVRSSRVPAFQVELRPPLRVHLDGDDLGEAHNLSVRVERDALRVVV